MGDEQETPPIDLLSRVGTRPTPLPAPSPAIVERLDAPLPPRRPLMLVGEDADEPKTSAIPSPRTPPAPGEIDLIATPLPTPDDWHRFELALRRVKGVRQLRTEYYRHGVLKVRVAYDGSERLGTVMRAGLPGYRVRVIGEDRSTLQVLVSGAAGERRPG